MRKGVLLPGCLLASLLFFPVFATAAKFKDEINPTVDPIGGAPGYRDIKLATEARHVAGTRLN